MSNFNESGVTVFRERLKKNWPIWLVAFATFVNGVVSVLQIMLTRLPIKPSHFRTLLPFGQYYINRSLTLVLGFMLLYLSIHLLQRRRIAWWVATVCAGLAFVLHIAHLHLWYTAISTAIAFILLLVFRKRFTVRPESRSLLQGFGLLVFSILFALMYGAVGFWLLDIRDFGVHITFINALVRTFREFTLIGNNDLVAQTRYAVWFIQSLRILGVVTGGFAFYSLFRPVVYHIETLPHNREKAHALLMTAHHIAVDGWSYNLMIDDLAALYAARVAGRADALPARQNVIGQVQHVVTLVVGQMHFQELQAPVDVIHQAEPLYHQMHRSHTTTVHRPGPLRHLIVDITGFEHGSRLVLPVLGLQSTFDSLLAVPKDFGIASIHSKWPFVGCYVLGRTCVSPHIDGHFEFFVQTLRKNHA